MEQVLTGGGAGGLVVATAYAYQQWRASRREDNAQPRVAATSAITDAATANALLLASLKEEREEVGRLSGRVQELETQNALLYERMRDQRREYEAEIKALRDQVDGFSRKLTQLEARFRNDPTPQQGD